MIRPAREWPGWRRLFGLGVVLCAMLALAGCTLADLVPGGAAGGGQAGGDGGEPPSGEEPPAGGDLLQIDAIEVLILESFPVQVHVQVRGTVPDACTEIGQISQERAGNDVTVTIATSRDPAALCAQVLTPVETVVPLDGEFPAGEYTVTVNGVDQTFRI